LTTPPDTNRTRPVRRAVVLLRLAAALDQGRRKAVKRVRGLRLIMPKWTERLAPEKALAPAPKKVRDEEAVTARNGVTSDV